MSLKLLLEKSGLSNYQQKIFLSLIKNPHSDAKKLSAIAEVPLGRIYSEIESLEHLNLIESSNSRPKRFFINNARSKIISLLEKEKEKFEVLEKTALDDLGTNDQLAEIFHLTSEIRQSQIDSFRWAKEEVCQCLGIIHKPSENKDLKSIYEKEIISAVKRGVAFKALYVNGQEPPKAMILLAKSNPDLFKIRYSQLPIPRFDIVDNRQILFKIQDPLDTSTTVGTIVINNFAFAKKLRSKFMNLWQESEKF